MKPLRVKFFVALAFAAASLFPAVTNAQTALAPGDLIKVAGNTSVYYYGADYKRYVFPNDATFHTWYATFDAVKVIPQSQLAFIPIGGNVTYKPASRLVKITTDPTVYAVSKNGILRGIASEQVAAAAFGANWNRQVDDIPDAFFTNYRVGAPLTNAADYNKPGLTAGVPSIDADKLLTPPPAGYIDVLATTGYTPNAITVDAGTAVTWISLDSSMPSITGTPTPSQTALPGFGTTTIPMGQTWSYTFTQAGTWGYKNANYANQDGTVTVNTPPPPPSNGYNGY